MPRATRLWLAPLIIAFTPVAGHASAPVASDPALTVECFAASPDIVHPVGVAFDRRGRLLVIESHSHFRPKDYKGPPHDRIRILEDTDGDGKADKFSTFYEGTRATMGIAAHPDGSIYIATRNEILRLRDTKGTGKADEARRIVFLDTKGDYPHNGLCGLEFDSKGNLYFGMGENLGADYKLTGSDGTTLTGGGEGGNIYWCTADGKMLRKIATGFWNPFGICRDIFGRLFAVDNDPDSMPPCRMLHVVERGDYGYQFRYGRSGRHPFQAWDGQLPGTLPMVCGVGEAPCQILSYESDGLPAKYRGSLLVASWADHRIERYEPKERGASVTAERLPFVQGGEDFRPVGIAVAPDGSLFVSDWVKRDYNLHGKGAVWHVRMKSPPKVDRPTDPMNALFSDDRSIREAAARKLAGDEPGRAYLRTQLHHATSIRVRAASVTALVDAGDDKLRLAEFAQEQKTSPLAALGVRALVARDQWHLEANSLDRLRNGREPPSVCMEALALFDEQSAADYVWRTATDPDPFLRHAAVRRIARFKNLGFKDVDARQPITQLLALRASELPDRTRHIRDFLSDPDPDVRFLAAKWIADEKLTEYRGDVVKAMQNPQLDVRMYLAYATALARIDGQEVNETALANYFAKRLQDDTVPPALRIQLLRQVPSNHPKLTVDLLGKLLANNDDAIKLEAVRALVEHPNPQRRERLLAVLGDAKLPRDIRSFAILGLVDHASDVSLMEKVKDDTLLQDVVHHDFAKRVALKTRPHAKDNNAWLTRLEGRADPAAGRRVFFHPKLAGCYKCHRCEGRGADVGPDLSTIGRTERRSILESILQPSAQVAPHYQAWTIEMNDGKLRTGMLLHTNLDEYTYLDAQGERFKINTRDVAETRPAAKSIMPDGLVDVLTDQELRDLLAYLCTRK
jgi:putative membrane-bound dehydrogenase-like protein